MAYTTIDNPELFFQTKLYSGTGSSQSVTLDGDENMQPDWVWGKGRTLAGYNHGIVDSVRGVSKLIYSNLTDAEDTYSTGITSLNTDGFTTGSGNVFNNGSNTYVAWCWKTGTSFSNDASATGIGTIDSSGSVSDDSGFSIVSYTGTGSAGTIKHGLSSTPLITLIKQRSSGGTGGGHWNFITYQIDGTSDELNLNKTAAKTDRSITAPTSSVFSVDTSDERNDSGQTYICYCFAEKKGYSKFGTYTGNGNADGTFVYTGFKPAFVMTKKTSSSTARNWCILDNKRSSSGANVVDDRLFPNLTDAEDSSTSADFLSNGIKFRDNAGEFNQPVSYIYMAFAESPFVNSNGVPCNAR